jgi:hypothetical protein
MHSGDEKFQHALSRDRFRAFIPVLPGCYLPKNKKYFPGTHRIKQQFATCHHSVVLEERR